MVCITYVEVNFLFIHSYFTRQLSVIKEVGTIKKKIIINKNYNKNCILY